LARVIFALAAIFLGQASAAADRPVVVASKIDTEGALLGAMIVAVLEKAGVPVENRLQLGPTRVVRAALVAGEIDLYPEYTGNGAFFHDVPDEPAWKNGAAGYDLVKRLDRERHDLVWLEPAPANNTWLIAVRGDLARREKLATMEDFARFVTSGGLVKLAASAEFVESPAALPSFERTYGFVLPRSRIVVLPGGDTSVMMRAAAEHMSGVNAAMVYGSDGAIAALDLVVMSDSRGAQIVYQPAAVVRRSVLERHAAIGPALSRLFAALSLRRLQELNAEIAVDGWPAREVARRFLEENGLLK
jgi:osmoprotectant transport system substrate-binding protein